MNGPLRYLLALLLALTVIQSGKLPSAGAAMNDSQKMLLFSQANDAFRAANDALSGDPEAARVLFRKALLRYQKLADEGVDNGKLYYDIGNTYFRLGELGKAIVNYRRAEQFIPDDENLRQNLDYALGQRLDKIEPKTEELLFKTLFFWHYDLSTTARASLFAFFYVAFWIVAVLLLWKRERGLVAFGGGALIFALLFLASLLLERSAGMKKQAGVITAAEVVARKGDSESYQPSFQEPLHAGTEFNLVQNRQQWLYIELEDGRRCWVPAGKTELVQINAKVQQG